MTLSGAGFILKRREESNLMAYSRDEAESYILISKDMVV
jgi:hypothetical protein